MSVRVITMASVFPVRFLNIIKDGGNILFAHPGLRNGMST